jgi:hypothetical protein
VHILARITGAADAASEAGRRILAEEANKRPSVIVVSDYV